MSSSKGFLSDTILRFFLEHPRSGETVGGLSAWLDEEEAIVRLALGQRSKENGFWPMQQLRSEGILG